MKIEVKITARQGYTDGGVDVTVGEEIVGGSFDTADEAAVLQAGLGALANEAVARARKQIAAQRMIAESKAPA